MSTYQLRTDHRPTQPPPTLDADQRAVVEHPGGPLLLLAGPGTGKTTTLVESVVDRIERRGLAPEQVLVLTFSRKAAGELRTRIAARLGRTTSGSLAYTFHAFCYALVRRFSDPVLYRHPPTLLSAPEHDVRLRELVDGTRREGNRVDWPVGLRPALGTRGLATELRALAARTRALGLDPADLEALGREHGRADWVAGGQFLAESLEVLDQQHLVDYAEIVHRAGIIAADPAHQATLRRELRYVVVDEYQDTDPAQVRLLHALAGDGHDLLAVGDPDQSIYAFRGADVRGLLGFPTRFRTRDDDPAPTLTLSSVRRSGPAVVAAAKTVVSRLPVPGPIDAEAFRRLRSPSCVDPPFDPGDVGVRTFVSPAAEAESIAELLRRAHLDDEVPWSQMAVLVRSGLKSIPRLQRALAAAGVPVTVAGDELPLRAQPAVQTLLRALRLTADLASGRSLRPDDVEVLLTSPLGAMSPAGVRRLCRSLRERDRADHDGVRPPRPSGQLLAQAVAEPQRLPGPSGPEAARVQRLALLLGRAADSLAADAAVEDVLWMLWDGTGWPGRLQRAAQHGGAVAPAAHRDLDAVVQLFGLAARARDRHQRRGLGAFLDEVDAQEIPADPTFEQTVRPGAVRLLTAHRAKGLEWRLVVVAAVQEGSWPYLRPTGSLLGTDRLAADGELPTGQTTARLLAEERRLFYVALTRARERVVVTAVRGPSESGEQPSRFLDDLGVKVGEPEPRPRRALSLRGLLGELRARAEATDDPRVRQALARRIARLARSGVLPAADPDRWWGVLHTTDAEPPVRPPDDPVALSASAVQAIDTCPLRWFLSREAGGEQAGTNAQGFGSIVHALAAAVLDGAPGPDAATLLGELDRVWGQLRFPVSWASAAERQEAASAVERLLDWHRADRGRTALAAEVPFEVVVPVGADQALLRGSMDRVEVDADGRAVVVDLKTGKSAPTAAEVAEQAQLGTYQIAVAAGALDELAGRQLAPGGAELVHLRHQLRTGVKVQRQPPPTVEQPLAADDQLQNAVNVIRAERFLATPGKACGHCDFRDCCPAQAAGRTLFEAPDAAAPGRTSDEPR